MSNTNTIVNITMVSAINTALKHAMSIDDKIVVLGQDVGKAGGVFRVTDQLLEIYGADRVIDMPLSEALIAGSAVGMAVSGLKPVAEYQFMGFSVTGLDQLCNHASRIRSRTMGTKTCPLVVRMPFGSHVRAPEHHVESLESLFTHIPGLKVCSPTNAQAAYDLTIDAIKCPDPVIVLEPLHQYHVKSSLQEANKEYTLGKSFVVQPGSDITVISWGDMLCRTLQALKSDAYIDKSIELIDLATLSPIDYETIITSVQKTGRCVIVQESCLSNSIAQDIAATVSNQAFSYLRGPCQVVSAPDAVIPYFRNTSRFLPTAQHIQDACNLVLSY
mgnify:CR=1 FL=1